MDGEIQENSASGLSPGAILAAARTAHGLTVEHVAGRLKLSSFQVQAIEADNFSVLPGAVFSRGFVKNYARLLNLDAEPLIRAMAQPDPQESVQQDERLLYEVKGVALNPVRYRKLPLVAAVVAGVVGALAYYEFVLNEPSAPPPAPVKAAPASTSTSTSAAVAVEHSVPTPPPAEPSTVQADGDKAAAVAAVTRRELHFLFSTESWVEVRDGHGNVLFSQINLPGSERRVEGDPPFSVVVGRAHGVRLTYTGAPVDLAAHATEDVARLRLE
jgi:cytoskeleton protein RodZ